MYPADPSAEPDEKPFISPGLQALFEADGVEDTAYLMDLLPAVYNVRALDGLEAPASIERPDFDFSNCSVRLIDEADDLGLIVEEGISTQEDLMNQEGYLTDICIWLDDNMM